MKCTKPPELPAMGAGTSGWLGGNKSPLKACLKEHPSTILEISRSKSPPNQGVSMILGQLDAMLV
jgi:hypothetical protein